MTFDDLTSFEATWTKQPSPCSFIVADELIPDLIAITAGGTDG